jgi:hypothetical protein
MCWTDRWDRKRAIDGFILICIAAIAVGRDIFRQDSDRFVEALMRIQSKTKHEVVDRTS